MLNESDCFRIRRQCNRGYRVSQARETATCMVEEHFVIPTCSYNDVVPSRSFDRIFAMISPFLEYPIRLMVIENSLTGHASRDRLETLFANRNAREDGRVLQIRKGLVNAESRICGNEMQLSISRRGKQ